MQSPPAEAHALAATPLVDVPTQPHPGWRGGPTFHGAAQRRRAGAVARVGSVEDALRRHVAGYQVAGRYDKAPASGEGDEGECPAADGRQSGLGDERGVGARERGVERVVIAAQDKFVVESLQR